MLLTKTNAMKFKIFLLHLLFFSLSTNIFAKHIIGGIITYEYKDNGNYRFTMKIYRDCNGGGAVLDGDDNDPATPKGAYIVIYEQTANSSMKIVNQIDVLLSSKNNVPKPDYPCLATPPNICVEEGIYEFNYTIPNFPSTSTFHIVYQRCCRNNSIVNIINPKDIGATYSVSITPAAMTAKSSSPVFKSFPPTVICSGVPFTFDHSATDKDGDKLVYKICSPLEGAGPDLSASGANTFSGVRPRPSAPPPYKDVLFESAYSSATPLGAMANLKIDPNTGIMTGVPNINGQFVVGVCVEEYRNGVLLSKTLRDFQFNIASCDALVAAGIAAQDTSIFQKKYTVRSCGLETITFKNGSTQEQFIKNYLWNFNVAGQIVTSTDKNPTIKFPGLGTYTGYMVANPGLKPCSDTAKVEVQIYPAIKADFKTAYDTCIAGFVQFTDLSVANSGAVAKWNWNYADGNKGSIQNPKHEYKIPGNFKVNLRVEDKNKCVDTITKNLRYFPVPPLLIVKPDTGIGCQPITMKIKNLSYPIDKTYKIEWDLGDGSTSSEINPVHTYQNPGIYSLNLKVTSPIGCKAQASYPNLIEVKPSPKADFEFTPKKLSSLQTFAKFTDKSMGANKWSWQFGKNEGSSAFRNPSYNFQDTGLHVVRLIVTHPSGCRDTLSKLIDIEPIATYFLPNAFTPNYDNTNDEFKGKGVYEGINGFKMIVFNRWGERVYETNDIEEGWNGRKNNTGELAPEGVYVYYVTFTGPRNKAFSYKGFATLIR